MLNLHNLSEEIITATVEKAARVGEARGMRGKGATRATRATVLQPFA